MRLTDEQIRELKQAIENLEGDEKYIALGKYGSLLDTIEALQQEAEDLKLYSLQMENGEINIRVGGEHARIFANSLIQFFKQNGGENFVTTTGLLGGEKYEITVRKCGGKTPAEKLSDLQQDVDQHIIWNEAHTRARVELSEENKKLREALGQARQALELILKKHTDISNHNKYPSSKSICIVAIQAIDKIGGGGK